MSIDTVKSKEEVKDLMNASFRAIDEMHNMVQTLNGLSISESEPVKKAQIEQVSSNLLSAASALLDEIKNILIKRGVSIE